MKETLQVKVKDGFLLGFLSALWACGLREGIHAEGREGGEDVIGLELGGKPAIAPESGKQSPDEEKEAEGLRRQAGPAPSKPARARTTRFGR